MSGPRRSGARLVLVGAGHGHLVALDHWRRNGALRRPLPASGGDERELEVLVIDPGRFSYSGMASGVVAGDYSAADASFDPAALVARAGARLLRDEVVSIAGGGAEAWELALASGGRMSCDVLSLNVGSAPALPLPPGLEGAFAVKPVSRLHALGPALADAGGAGGPCGPLLVVGGGVTAVEVACCAAARVRGRTPVRLLHPGERLSIRPPAARRRLEKVLRARGVAVEGGFRVAAIEPGAVIDGAGDRRPWETLVVAAGLVAAPLVQSLVQPLVEPSAGLPERVRPASVGASSQPGRRLEVGPRGLRVTHALHATVDDRIFAVGDCADIGDLALPAVGVYGVRAGPVLADNLLARLANRPLRHYEPQRRYLSIMNLGHQEGLASWGYVSLHGRLSWRLKDWIDRRFLAALAEGS